MPLTETIENLVSVASLLIAYLSWRSSQRTAKEQLALQRTTARLAEQQLEQIESQRQANAPALRISIESVNRHTRKFVIRNVGNAPARNVAFVLNPHGSGDNPLLLDDYREKFPVPIMPPGSEVGVLAAFSFNSARAFDVTFRWETEDGRTVEEQSFVAL